MSAPVILLGMGGHSRVLLDALRCSGIKVLGYVDRAEAVTDVGIPFLGGDGQVLDFPAAEIMLVNGVGSLALRSRLFDEFKARGYRFAQVIHPSVVISKTAVLGEGVQVMAGAVVQTGSCVGENVIINTRAGIDHDCSIGAHSHIAVGTTIAGNVTVGQRVLVGAGSTVIQGIAIGDDSVVGAGAAVIRDVPAGKTVVGVPARLLNEESGQ